MRKRGAGGFSLLTVIFIVVVFGVLGTAAVALVTGSGSMLVDEYHSQQAFDVAQAGLHVVAKELVDDTDWSDNSTVTGTFGSGTFVVTYLDQTPKTAAVRSDGTVAGITISTSQALTAGGIAAFMSAIYTEQNVNMTGSTSGDIYGGVSAGGGIDPGDVVFHDEAASDNEDAAMPTPDCAYWQGIADYTIAGNFSFEAGTYDGIYYITGDVAIQSNVLLKGTIITRGKVTMNGSSNVTITATAPNPAILAEGTIKINGSANVNITGFVISLSDIMTTGNTDLTAVGGFVSAGDITLTGNTDIDLSYSDTYAPGDGFSGGEMSEMTISDWREVY